MSRLFGGIRAPSTLGSHLRSYNFANVAQLEKAGRGLLIRLAREAPLLRGGRYPAFAGIDSSQKRVYGYAKQGARFGVTKIASRQVKVCCLNPLIAAVSTPDSAPVIAATRLRGGHLPSGRFSADAAWLSIAAITRNLLRGASALAGRALARARGATLRRDLVAVPARTARHGRGHLTLHLPENWHRAREWLSLFEVVDPGLGSKLYARPPDLS